MKDMVRTLAAGAAGAVIASVVISGAPAIADQVGKVAPKNSVTSKSIKNGTVKTKDLAADINASLAKANSALQGVPDNGVTNSKLADNAVGSAEVAADSLAAVDLGVNSVGASELGSDAVGSLELADGAVGISNFSRGGTANAVVPGLGNGACGTTTIDIGDFTFGFMPIVTPGLAAEPGLFVEGARIQDGDEILVRVCNRSGAAYGGDTEPFLWGALL